MGSSLAPSMDTADTTSTDRIHSKHPPKLPPELWGNVLQWCGLKSRNGILMHPDRLIYGDSALMDLLRKRQGPRTRYQPRFPECHLLQVNKVFHSEGIRWLYGKELFHFSHDTKPWQMLAFLTIIGAKARSQIRSLIFFGPGYDASVPHRYQSSFERMCDTVSFDYSSRDKAAPMKVVLHFMMENLNLHTLRLETGCYWWYRLLPLTEDDYDPTDPPTPLTAAEKTTYNNHLRILARGVAEGKVRELHLHLKFTPDPHLVPEEDPVYQDLEARFAPFVRVSGFRERSAFVTCEGTWEFGPKVYRRIVLRKGVGAGVEWDPKVWELGEEEDTPTP